MVERRRGGEAGVRAVTLPARRSDVAGDGRGVFSRDLLEAAMAHAAGARHGDYRKLTSRATKPASSSSSIETAFKAAVAMLNGWDHEGDGGAFTFAGRIAARTARVACQFYLHNLDPFGHFAHSVRAIDAA